MLASSGVGVNILIALSGGTNLNYYAQKYLWLVESVTLVVEVVLILGILSRVKRLSKYTFLALGLVAVVTAWALTLVPTTKEKYIGEDLVSTMLTSNFPFVTESDTHRVLENTDPARPVYLWRTYEAHEYQINFWLLRMQDTANSKDLALRERAYDLVHKNSVESLCDVGSFFDDTLIVETTYEKLERELEATCPAEARSLDVRVVSPH